VADRCEITELPVDQCAHCKTKGDPRTTRPALRRGWFEARYPGQCRSCGDWFAAGTHITGTDGSDGWTAECCADEVGEP
jgi:hypothetical protein